MNVVVLGGGTATNHLVPCFNKLGTQVSYILPISDNGGSTSEILRVIGGPAIGDIRSRLVRVIDDLDVIKVLSYRLPDDSHAAKVEWNLILEGGHEIWNGVPGPVRECIRPFLAHIQSELLKRSKISKPFQFAKSSIGNLFLTGARLFLGSLDAAIELFSRIGRCDKMISVIPSINSNHMYHISALLENNIIITGQSQISHPSNSTSSYSTQVPVSSSDSPNIWGSMPPIIAPYALEEDEEEYATPFYAHPDLKTSQLYFEKIIDEQPLPASVKRVFYINPYGEEISPLANSRVVKKLKKCNMVVYSIGSLLTSLMPMVILGNVAEVIVETNTKKVLLMNSTYDRETFGISGLMYVNMIIEAMETAVLKYKKSKCKMDHMKWPATAYITDIVYANKGQIGIDQKILERKGIRIHEVDGDMLDSNTVYEVLSNF